MPRIHPPRRIETERLVLRPLELDEAQLLQDAIDASVPELQRWMPWAAGEPKPVEETRAYIEASRAKFEAGEDFAYPILTADETEVVGSTGFHVRCGEGCVEIGYWIRSDRTGRGYATEVTHALTRIALAMDGVERVILEVAPDNHASRRVPERLGFPMVGRREMDMGVGDGEVRDWLVYELRDLGSLLEPRARES
jgi:RimJ/RimL family protein N-acetyltransferase